MPEFMPVNNLYALSRKADRSISKLQNSIIINTCYCQKLVYQATKYWRQQAEADTIVQIEQYALLYKLEKDAKAASKKAAPEKKKKEKDEIIYIYILYIRRRLLSCIICSQMQVSSISLSIFTEKLTVKPFSIPINNYLNNKAIIAIYTI